MAGTSESSPESLACLNPQLMPQEPPLSKSFAINEGVDFLEDCPEQDDIQVTPQKGESQNLELCVDLNMIPCSQTYWHQSQGASFHLFGLPCIPQGLRHYFDDLPIRLTEEEDMLLWKECSNGKFSLKSSWNLRSLSPVEVVHIFREANSSADFLAKFGGKKEVQLTSARIEDFPKDLKGFIQLDLKGTPNIRISFEEEDG